MALLGSHLGVHGVCGSSPSSPALLNVPGLPPHLTSPLKCGPSQGAADPCHAGSGSRTFIDCTGSRGAGSSSLGIQMKFHQAC